MTIEKLGTKINDLVKEYTKEVLDEIEKELDSTALKVLDYIKINCPKSNHGSNHLSDSFVLTQIGDGGLKTIYISSKTKGRLVHLVELGFKHRNGKMVSPRPFMRPAFDELTPKMIEDIKTIINGGI